MRIARVADQSGTLHYARPTAERDRFEELAGSWESGFRPTGTMIGSARLVSPLDPPVVYAIGLNYHDHAVETGARIPEYPVIFMKNIRAVIGPGQPIRLPRRLRSDEVDSEAELALVLGRECRGATRATAMEHVAGFTCANDVSARDWQKNARADNGAGPNRSTHFVRSDPGWSHPTNYPIRCTSPSREDGTAPSCRRATLRG